MTQETTPQPRREASINDNVATSSPSPKSTLIGFGSVIALIVLYVVYYKTIGF